MELAGLPTPTWLQRLLKIEVGKAPRWLHAPSDCAGLDVLGVIGSALLLTAIFGFRAHWAVTVHALVLLLLYLRTFGPFTTVERKARAIRRRAVLTSGTQASVS